MIAGEARLRSTARSLCHEVRVGDCLWILRSRRHISPLLPPEEQLPSRRPQKGSCSSRLHTLRSPSVKAVRVVRVFRGNRSPASRSTFRKPPSCSSALSWCSLSSPCFSRPISVSMPPTMSRRSSSLSSGPGPASRPHTVPTTEPSAIPSAAPPAPPPHSLG